MNVKTDLVNELKNDKYYLEIEIGRVLNDPTIPYREKLTLIKELLNKMVLNDSSTQLASTLFHDPQESQTTPATAAKNDPAPKVTHHVQGQSHGE